MMKRHAMKELGKALASIAIASALAMAACGGSKTGGKARLDGSMESAGGTQALGGTGAGGAIATGGTTTTGSGGIGSGGDGTGGTAGRATGGNGAGGIATATSDAGPGDAPTVACTGFTSQEVCDHQSECHSVFKRSEACTCTTQGCCMRFSQCADNVKADCTGPALCDGPQPSCDAPYILSYTPFCYEGCVRQSECPNPTCPTTAPTASAACGIVDHMCFYQDCGGAGRILASCSAGAWKLETVPCVAQSCAAGGRTPLTLPCESGQVCLLTFSNGDLVTPTCEENTCGTGPISNRCMGNLVGKCFTVSDPSSVTVRCWTSSSCLGGEDGCL